MSIQDLGAIGEFIGSIAVVVSLVYVAIQLRENTKSMHAAEANEVSKSLQQFSENILRDSVTKRLYQDYILTDKEYDEVENTDRFDLQLILQAAFLTLWRGFKASQLGYSDDELWDLNINLTRRSYFTSKIVKAWWDERGRIPFPQSFRDLVDEEFERAISDA